MLYFDRFVTYCYTSLQRDFRQEYYNVADISYYTNYFKNLEFYNIF